MSHFKLEEEICDVLRMDSTLSASPRSIMRRSKSTGSDNPARRQSTSSERLSKCGKPSNNRNNHLSINHQRALRNSCGSLNEITCGDRFIPNRSTTDYEFSQYAVGYAVGYVSKTGSTSRDVSPNGASNDEDSKCRILSFRSKAPEPSEAHVNGLKILYSSGRPKVDKSKNVRHIPSKPFKILDAPGLLDDFYLHSVDWSSLNHLAVILTSSVFIWNASDGSIEQLAEHSSSTDSNFTSVSWAGDGIYIAVADSNGVVFLYELRRNKLLRTMSGHSDRVGVMHWNQHTLATGSRSGSIKLHDVRVQEHTIATFNGHSQDVCGLRWSSNGRFLASGGNDNLVQIWDVRQLSDPVFTLNRHQSAVKAVRWCPWSQNVLSTGGGTADRELNIWNTQTGNRIKSVDTGSQVSAILWNEEYKELATGHGFNTNQLTIWKYPNLIKVEELRSHKSRILSLVSSPDNTNVASVAGDETIRIWNVWPLKEKKGKSAKDIPVSSIFQKIR